MSIQIWIKKRKNNVKLICAFAIVYDQLCSSYCRSEYSFFFYHHHHHYRCSNWNRIKNNKQKKLSMTFTVTQWEWISIHWMTDWLTDWLNDDDDENKEKKRNSKTRTICDTQIIIIWFNSIQFHILFSMHFNGIASHITHIERL